MIKKIIQPIKKNFNLLVLLAGLITTIYGVHYTYLMGFHSFDMAQNLIFIRDDVKIDLLSEGHSINTIESNMVYFETDTGGNIKTLEDTYAEGVTNLLKGIPLMLFGIFMIGYGIGKLEK